MFGGGLAEGAGVGGGSKCDGRGIASVLRLRGGVDNTRYYDVLKLPPQEEDENVGVPLLLDING